MRHIFLVVHPLAFQIPRGHGAASSDLLLTNQSSSSISTSLLRMIHVHETNSLLIFCSSWTLDGLMASSYMFGDGLLKSPSTCSGHFSFPKTFFPTSWTCQIWPDRPIPMVGRLCMLPLLVSTTVMHMIVWTCSKCYLLLVALQMHMMKLIIPSLTRRCCKVSWSPRKGWVGHDIVGNIHENKLTS